MGLALLAWVCLLTLTWLGWRAARADEEAERVAAFELTVRATEARVVQRMAAHEQLLRGAAGLFAAGPVRRQAFHEYVAMLQLAQSHAGIQGVGFARLVTAEGLSAHVADVRAEGYGEYQVRPAGKRERYSPVVFLEPFEGRNLRAFGYDMLSEPVRREAMERARDSGRAALTSSVRLVQETDEDVQAGTLLVMPVYRTDAQPAVDGHRPLLGWVYSPFRMGDLMRGILGGQNAGLDLQLFDGAEQRADALLFEARHDEFVDALHAVRALQVGGRQWTLVLAGEGGELTSSRSSVLAISGLSLGTIIAALLCVFAASRARALRALEEKRRSVESIETSRQITQATLDAMPQQICVLDQTGAIISVNRAWREFGAANGATNGYESWKYLAACRVGDDVQVFARDLQDVLVGRKQSASHQYPCHSPAQRRWFVVHAVRFSHAQGQARVVIVHHNVTDLVLSAEALRESEERLRSALSAARQVPWDLDTADVGSLTQAWSQLTGHRVSSRDAALECVHADDRPAVRKVLSDCLEGRAETVGVEFRLSAASGAVRWMRMQGKVTPGRSAARHIAGTITDIDELHDFQERMLRTTRLASVGTLAAGVAHEINNPLAWMHANLTLGLDLLGADLDARGRAELGDLLKETLDGTNRIASIVKALRSLGHPDLGGVHVIDVRAEILDAVQLVRNQLEQRATLSVDLPEVLPGVRAHTSELGRVFLNLLVNAAQAIEARAASKHTVSVAARVEGGQVVVAVSDTGCGIPAALRERIFEPFFTTRPVGHGSGLGLATAHSIVEQAGGRLRVESVEDRGATFFVSLPVAAPLPLAPTTSRPAPASAARRRVLVVDDEALVVKSLERRLGRQHEVTVLYTAEEALRRIGNGERWDVLLFDLMMPGIDGPLVYERLAQRHPELLAHLGFMTGGAFGERASEFLGQHAVVIVPKPIETARLLEVVELLARGEAA